MTATRTVLLGRASIDCESCATPSANGKLGAAVRAEYLRGKAAGLYDRLEHSAVNEFARMSDEELRQIIKANAKKH